MLYPVCSQDFKTGSSSAVRSHKSIQNVRSYFSSGMQGAVECLGTVTSLPPSLVAVNAQIKRFTGQCQESQLLEGERLILFEAVSQYLPHISLCLTVIVEM